MDEYARAIAEATNNLLRELEQAHKMSRSVVRLALYYPGDSRPPFHESTTPRVFGQSDDSEISG